MIKQKNLSIESLRGLAILLVVMGHVIGSAPDGGMKIDFPSIWRYLYIWIDYIQMPLFTAIAGWVYALKPIGSTDSSLFIYNKVKRLLIPMATVATLYFLIQYVTPGTNNKGVLSSIWQIYLFPYTIFWYLQSLFLIFVMVIIADKLLWLKSVSRWSIVLCGAYLLYIAQIAIIPYSVPNLFSFKGALDQLPYFIAGIGIQRYSDILYVEKSKIACFVLAIIGLVLLQFKWFYVDLPLNLYKCLLPLWLVPTLVILLNQRFSNKVFVYFGAYAYSIYLFHGFGTAGGRIILSYVNIHTELIVFIFAMAIAVFTPIIADKILSKNSYTRMLFLGKRV